MFKSQKDCYLQKKFHTPSQTVQSTTNNGGNAGQTTQSATNNGGSVEGTSPASVVPKNDTATITVQNTTTAPEKKGPEGF